MANQAGRLWQASEQQAAEKLKAAETKPAPAAASRTRTSVPKHN